MLDVSLEGPFKMKAETKLSLTPSKCDDIEFFGEKMHVCAVETITKVRFYKLLDYPGFEKFSTIYFSEYASQSNPAKKGFQIDARKVALHIDRAKVQIM